MRTRKYIYGGLLVIAVILLVSDLKYGWIIGSLLIAITVGVYLILETGDKAYKEPQGKRVIALIAVNGVGSERYYVPRGLTKNDLLVVGSVFTKIYTILGRAGSPGYRIDVIPITERPNNVPIATRVD